MEALVQQRGSDLNGLLPEEPGDLFFCPTRFFVFLSCRHIAPGEFILTPARFSFIFISFFI